MSDDTLIKVEGVSPKLCLSLKKSLWYGLCDMGRELTGRRHGSPHQSQASGLVRLTGRENIYVNGSVLGLYKREIDAKLHEIIDFAEIGDFMDTPVQYYSSGMGVR